MTYTEAPCFCIDTAYYVDRRCTKAHLRWLFYALQCAQLDAVSLDTGVPGLSREIAHSSPVPVPSASDQIRIADFLDKETTKIDKLIAKKRQLTKLLSEERNEEVRRATVEGIRQSELQTTPFAWLGGVPSHWTILPLKRIALRVDVGIAEAATHAYCDSGIPLIRSTNVKANCIDSAEILNIEPWFAEKNKSKYLHRGDIVTVRTGNAGVSVVIPEEFEKCQCFTLLMTTLKRRELPEFYCFYMNSPSAQTYFHLQAWGTAQANISVPILQMLPVPHPPYEEQLEIVAYLQKRLFSIDALLGVLKHEEQKLSEYRSSLIFAAITGQIDVRNCRSKEAAAACQ